MKPRIGILTYGSDAHGHCIQQKLEAQHDAWCCLIPSDELALRGRLSWSSSDGDHARLPTLDGDPVDVRTLDALWYRRASTKQPLPDGVDPAYELHIYKSIERTVEGILLEDFRGRWISHPLATQVAENKLVQLRAAQRAGLHVPATLVSQDPTSIRRFCAAHPGAILKPVATPRGVEVTKTAVVGDELLANDDVLALAPSIYQQCIPGTRHLRITLFGDHCIGALITAEDLDWRLDLTVPFQAHVIDAPLERMLRATLRDLGLVMGIFDVKLTPEGEPVFLEVNSQGQFLFVEALTGVALGDAFAAFLVDEATASSAAGSSRSSA